MLKDDIVKLWNDSEGDAIKRKPEIFLRVYAMAKNLKSYLEKNKDLDLQKTLLVYKEQERDSELYFKISDDAELEMVESVVNGLCKLTDFDFIYSYMSPWIKEPFRFMNLVRINFGSEETEVWGHVFLVMDGIRNRLLESTRPAKHPKKFDELTPTEEQVIEAYDSLENDSKYFLNDKDKVLELFISVAYFDASENSIRINNIEKISPLLEIMKRDLQLSRQEQIQFVHFIFSAKKHRHIPIEDKRNEDFPFYHVQDETERRKYIEQVIVGLLHFEKIDVLRAIYFCKDQNLKRGKFKQDSIYVENDTTINNSIVLNTFFGRIIQSSPSRSGTIFFADPDFIMKSCERAKEENIHLNFVVDDICWKEILSDYFSTASEYDVNIYCFDDIKALDKTEKLDKICLIFKIVPEWRGEQQDGQNRFSFDWNQLKELLYEKSYGTITVFEITSQKDAEQTDVITEWYGGHGKRYVNSIVLLPQGINNALSPKRKAFVMVRLFHSDQIRAEDVPKLKTSITKYLLIRSFNRQLLVLSSHKPIVKYWNPEASQILSDNARKEFADATYGQRLTNRTRNGAQRYDFSRELTIWTNWHIDERGLKRVEAYFTRDEVKGKSKRGIIIKGSKKRKVFSEGEDVEQWILTEYPFSELKYRKSSKDINLSENSEFADVQSSVIAAFEDKFTEENISIKTILYLYPAVKDTMSERNYQILKGLVLIPEIGFLMIQDIEAEKVTELLQTYFPNDTQEVLKRRFRVLSDLVNFAQRIGFCQKNDLKETLLDRNRNDRLFGQVRRALAKRHLTKDEQKCFYDAAYKASIK